MIRKAEMADLDRLTEIESICFPSAEAAWREALEQRLLAFPLHFWVMEEDGLVIGFINGMATDEPVIADVMFENAFLHKADEQWQSVFGLDVLPAYRGRGYAAQLMQALIADARAAGRRGCILTCKEHLLHYYEKFGYRSLGISDSQHGGAQWYDMVLEF